MQRDSAEIGSKVRRALAWSTLNNLVLRVGNFAVGIVLARLVAPSEFGVFAVALTVQTIVVAFAELGMTSDLIRNGRIKERAGTTTTLALASSGVLALAVSGFAGPVSRVLGSAEAAPVVQVMSLTLVLSGLSVVPYAAIQRDFRQSTQLALDGLSLVVGTAATVVLYLLGFGVMALALSRVIAQALVCLLQYLVTDLRPRFGFDRRVAGALIAFGLPLAGANLLSWVVMNIDYMVVGGLAGALTLGYYVLAFNVASWPMTALGQAIRAVALPGFARLDNLQRQATSFGSALAVSWAVALLAGVLLSSLAGVLIPLLYGVKWVAASRALAGLAFFGALRVVFDLTATFLIAVGATRPVLWVQVVWVLVLAPAMAVGLTTFDLTGAGWAHVVVAAGVVLPIYAVLLRRYRVRLGVLIRHLAVPLIGAVPAVVAGDWVARQVGQPILALTTGGVVTAAIYLAPLARWLPRRLQDLRRLEGVDADPSTATSVGDVTDIALRRGEGVRAVPAGLESSAE